MFWYSLRGYNSLSVADFPSSDIYGLNLRQEPLSFASNYTLLCGGNTACVT